MRRGVHVVNTARGALVDSAALVRALDAGIVAGAALDVTDPEPLPADAPLRSRPEVILTPHVALLLDRVDGPPPAPRGRGGAARARRRAAALRGDAMTTPLRCRTFAGGEYRTEKETFERRNPATDEVVAIADLADAAAVDAAVAAAVVAFTGGGERPASSAAGCCASSRRSR